MAYEFSPKDNPDGKPSPGGGGAPAAPAPQQSFDHLVEARIALARKARSESVQALNQVLADTVTLRDLYRKHHWQATGAAFYLLHLLFDRHYEEQDKLVDSIAERIHTLGGVAVATAADVAETTRLPRPPREREDSSQQLRRMIESHERVLYGVRAAARRAAELGDDGTNDLLVGDVIRANEKQSWLVQQHLNRARSAEAE